MIVTERGEKEERKEEGSRAAELMGRVFIPEC